MSSVELLSDRSSVTDISFRSMTEEQRQNALQPPTMGGRTGAGNVPVVPVLNLPRSGPLPSGQDPSSACSFWGLDSVGAGSVGFEGQNQFPQ